MADREEFIGKPVDPAFVAHIRGAFLRAGVIAAPVDLVAALNPPYATRLKAVQMFERIDNRQVQEQLIRDLETGARWLPVNARTGAALRLAPVGKVDWCTVADWGSAYLGVASLAQTIPVVGQVMGVTAVGIWATSKILC